MGKAVQSMATITFGTMGTNFAVELRGIAHEGHSRPSISLASKSSPTGAPAYTAGGTSATVYFAEKAPGALLDLGRLRCDILVEPDVSPPIRQPPELITVTFVKSTSTVTTAAAFSCNGFVTDYDAYSAPWEEEPLGSMTIELTPAGTNAMLFTTEA